MRLKTMTVCLLALMAPLAYAHEPAGTPKIYCEPAAEWNTHDYGPPATGRLLWGFTDGNLDDCDGDFDPTDPICWAEELAREDLDGDGDVCEAFDYDEHAEWSRGGAWLLSCDELCGDDGLGNPGSGSLVCFGSQSHHASQPTVRVVDNSGLTGIEFRVAADTTSLTGPDPVDNTVCGDIQSDVSQVCFDVCTVTFPPGLDGSYQVYVVGTAGHVCTGGCTTSDGTPSAGLIVLHSDGTWSTTLPATGWTCSRTGNAVTCTPLAGSRWSCPTLVVTAAGLSLNAHVQGTYTCNTNTGSTTAVTAEIFGFGVSSGFAFGHGTVTSLVCSTPVSGGSWVVTCGDP